MSGMEFRLILSRALRVCGPLGAIRFGDGVTCGNFSETFRASLGPVSPRRAQVVRHHLRFFLVVLHAFPQKKGHD